MKTTSVNRLAPLALFAVIGVSLGAAWIGYLLELAPALLAA